MTRRWGDPNGGDECPAIHLCSPGQRLQVPRIKPAPSHPSWLELRPQDAGIKLAPCCHLQLTPQGQAERGRGWLAVWEKRVWILWARGLGFGKGQLVNTLGCSLLEAKLWILCRYLYNKRENKCPQKFFINEIQNTIKNNNGVSFLGNAVLLMRRVEFFLGDNISLKWGSELVFPITPSSQQFEMFICTDP